MKKHIFAGLLLAGSLLCGCHNGTHDHVDAEPHDHSLAYTGYSPDYEVFVESHPFEAGQETTFAAHITRLSDFAPLDSGIVVAAFAGTSSTVGEPTHPGIFKFALTAPSAGPATISFTIDGTSVVDVPVEVYADHHAAHAAAEEADHRAANAVAFSKEMSWNCDFATDSVAAGPFASVIRAMALVELSAADLRTVSSRTAGTVVLHAGSVVPGKSVSAGEHLMTVDATGQADNNLSVTMSQARVEYEAARRDFERKSLLAQEQIVSQSDLLEAGRRFEEAEARYHQLERSFPGGAQNVCAPASGVIAEVFTANGRYVEAGAPLFSLSQGRALTLTAKVPAADRSALSRIEGATVRIPATGRTYTLEQLGGHLIGYGRTAAGTSALIPVTFEADAAPDLVPGTYVEMFIAIANYANEVSVPKEAVVEEMGGTFVFVQLTPELFEKRPVTLGRTDGLRCVVSSGLDGSERIVTRGAVLVRLSQSSGKLDAHAGHVH